jgi:hypothetical protein
MNEVIHEREAVCEEKLAAQRRFKISFIIIFSI